MPCWTNFKDIIVLIPQAKHLQFVSGVHSTSYWTATFAWDLINALLPVIISFILFAAFQIEAYEGDGLAAIFLLLVGLFGEGDEEGDIISTCTCKYFVSILQ